MDHHGDQVMPGAFTKSLKQLSRSQQKPKMLWHHDSRYPIGIWHDIREDSKGLFVKGQLLLDIQQGRETYALMQAGVLDGLSIGFRPLKSRRHPSLKGRILEEIDLYEISLVTFASNPEAKITHLKSSWEKTEPDLLNSLQELYKTLATKTLESS